MPCRIFVINPGSTSTKLAYFEDEVNVIEEKLFHDSAILMQFDDLNDQLDYRMEVIHEFIKDNNIDMKTIDAIACRGGSSYSVKSGCYEVDDLLVQHTREARGGIHHVANLGVQLGRELQKIYGCRLFMTDPTVVNELQDLARVTGVRGVYRRVAAHVLNQKATARLHASKLGKRYEDCRFIVCHIDGGITVSAHENGLMIDSNNGSGGDGPFTPTRMGSMAVTDLIESFGDVRCKDLQMLCMETGGLSSYFGTSDSDLVHKKVEEGDPMAVTVWKAMVYQICKCIGAMSVVLKGDVEAILLTGGLMRFDDIREMIEEYCGHIAPITVYPDELEMEALAAGALSVLRGEKEALHYTGRPVWTGFEGWPEVTPPAIRPEEA